MLHPPTMLTVLDWICRLGFSNQVRVSYLLSSQAAIALENPPKGRVEQIGCRDMETQR